ncbi:macro domain-containing protein [Actinoplanes philippinensis]|uniref:macro domain-containing protein n=1 Tax=Actinoplanes philippinensis TaxID=35752 RepID=UPI0033C3496B
MDDDQAPGGGPRAYLIGNCTFTVKIGSIPETSAEVLVSSDDNYLSMSGGVSAALSLAGGAHIAADARKHVPARLGDVVVTTAGDLPAKFVFHGITIDTTEMTYPDADCLSGIVTRCLTLADALGIGHIAFPALGTGLGGVPYPVAADAMTRAITEYLSHRPQHVTAVTLVLYSPADYLAQEVNAFYERAAGLAAQWTDSRRLRHLVDELETLLGRAGSPALRERVRLLRTEVAEAEETLAETATPATLEKLDVASPLSPPSRAADDIAHLTAAVVDWEDTKARETVLQLRLQSLRTQHNIIIGNRNQLEERKAKYGPYAVPLEVENALADILNEIIAKEEEIRAVKSDLADLGRIGNRQPG